MNRPSPASLLLAVAAACMAHSPHAAAAGTHYDLYLLAGQSNMDGRGLTSELTPAQQAPRPAIQLNYRNIGRDTGWVGLAPGYSVPPGFNGNPLPSGNFGLELGFGDRMAEADPGSNIALLKVSGGGSSLLTDWNPGNRPGNTQGAMYALLEDAVTDATAALTARGDTYTITGMLWHQGESDSTRTASSYAADLTNLIGQVRGFTGVSDLAFVMGQVYDNDNRDAIFQAQALVQSSVPFTAIASSSGLVAPDGTHFNAAGQLTLGQRSADAMMTLVPEPGTGAVVLLLGCWAAARRRPRVGG